MQSTTTVSVENSTAAIPAEPIIPVPLPEAGFSRAIHIEEGFVAAADD